MGKYGGTEDRPQWQQIHPLKAERVCFLRNGDQFFKGVTLAVSRGRYKEFDALLKDVTAALRPHVTLPSAITHFYRVDGSSVNTIDSFTDGEIILSCTAYDDFKDLEYEINSDFRRLICSVNRWNDLRIESKPDVVPEPTQADSSHTHSCSLESMVQDAPSINPALAPAQSTSKYFGKLVKKRDADSPCEYDVLRSLQTHPNIVELVYGIKLLVQEGYLVENYKKLHTNVESVIRKQGTLWEADARTVFRGTVAGITHMHRLQVVHRDIRPASLMLKVLPDGTPIFDSVKIGKFDLSAFYDGGKLTCCCGTLDYAAPEMMSGKGYDLQVDCWSLGISLFYMLYGKLPFGGKTDNKKFILSIRKVPLSYPISEKQHVSACANQVINGLLKKDPAERDTIEQISQHAWIKVDHL